MNALLFSAVSGVLMMFSGLLFRNKESVRVLANILLILTMIAAALELKGVKFIHLDSQFFAFDNFALLFTIIATFCTLIFFLLSGKDMERVGLHYSDYFALIFFILSGVIISASFQSLLMLFLGIEILSIPLYILTGSDKRSLKGNEASLKYFLLGSFSTGLMLMGIVLIYGATGTFTTTAMNFEGGKVPVLFIAGMMMLLFSMSFKVSAAPFHFWTPDVYDGAPTVFTSFMATIVKAAGFIAFMRLFADAFSNIQPEWKLLVAIIAAATLFIGNITAVFQQSVKRMLAYSSISQAGFMMLAVYSLTPDAKEGILLYAAAYSLATIGIFAVLIKMKDYSFDGFNGFARQQPLVAATLVILLLSLAGIPLTGGFLAKFFMLRATLDAGNLWLAIFAVLMAAISVYYYFRLIQSMYFKEATGQAGIQVNGGFKSILVVVAALTIILGVFPNLLLYWLYF
jgi:NADH-quinone oxidoreductase subunit N